MIDIKRDIDQIIENVMGGLKDFQRATVEYVDSLYRDGQKRILISDEVGLGKTLVAKGLVASLAKLRLEEKDNLFKVVYICSNVSIAEQNIRKLQITPKTRIEGTHGSRLSMQHLHIFRQEHDPELLDGFIQLIPLTPETSFRMTKGTGAVFERALMYALLRRVHALEPYLKALDVLMMANASKSWSEYKSEYETRVLACDKATGHTYISFIVEKVTEHLEAENHKLLNALIFELKKIKENGYRWVRSGYILGQLRRMFAVISTDLLEPDFVIMDEFQRFKYLLQMHEESESGMLARRFLKKEDVRILLLSATPYKMYYTIEEIDKLMQDEHYLEFFELIEFLQDNSDNHERFKVVWNSYSEQLREISRGDSTIIKVKRKAEDALFKVISRTERHSATELADIIDDKFTKTYLMPDQSDIKSYMNMQKLLDDTEIKINVPVDYIKSSPYIMSFMQDYQLKKKLEKYFLDHPEKVRLARKNHLWIERKQVEAFKKISPSNARLEYVQHLAFENNAHRLLWVPPSKPYYELSGPFQDAQDFSKILVFSSWQMVPRMLATMISYESERKNVEAIVANSHRHTSDVKYFTSETSGRRYPAARLNFSMSLGEPRGMPLFCLLYPSKKLSECFDPIDVLNKKLSLKELEEDIKNDIQKLLDNLPYKDELGGREDERWYYLAPILLDDPRYVEDWFDAGRSLAEYVDEENDTEAKAKHRTQSGFLQHLEILQNTVKDKKLKLGRKPKDLLDVMSAIALASPAVCAMRTYQRIGGKDYRSDMSSQLAKIFINRMNTPESTAVIEAVYGKSSDDAHWKNLLQYCKAGNFQAMLDEYAHILVESNGLSHVENRTATLHNLILTSMNVHTASYNVDTFNDLRSRVKNRKFQPVKIRSHFAVTFTKSDGGVDRGERREKVRHSFNSPFRPFVLASTSIGQEGLDFHYYCRKIVHWNLPSNPIDIEQREGRINRYKSLAIRQNVAKRYGDIVFGDRIWYEMFQTAYDREKKENASDLVPFWGLLPTDDMIKIERIVPMYSFSREISKYDRMMKILTHYRLTLGQPRQEELLEHIVSKEKDIDLSELFINLSPFYKNIRSKY